ncbi:MAG: hypothetical protein KF696_01175 [Planctomycetes bacterium]|nr:hypothetical protein [Planctomycetota bacterium]MCW8134449.1 hypothetical protein [Planctomycetota bacterium]
MPRVYRASVFTNQKQHWQCDLLSEVYSDGTFELLPILDTPYIDKSGRHFPATPEEWLDEVGLERARREHLRTYGDLPSWHDPKKSVADYVKFDKASEWVVHDDPDLHTLMAYGDVNSVRGRALFNMRPGDWITFIAHLAYAKKPGQPNPKHAKTGWYLVGCLKAQHIEFAGAGRTFSDRAKGHAHWLWSQYEDMRVGDTPHNMIICGDRQRKDQRFDFAVPLLTREDAMRLIRDKHNKPLDPVKKNPGKSVKSSVNYHTRTGRCIGDTSKPSDKAYLRELRSAILERNPTLKNLLW